jgi:imidazolonepropionase-like amidohydrolase
MGKSGARGTRPEPLPLSGRNGNGKMVMDAMHAGAVIVAGTDRPLAIKVHGDLVSDVQIGMTPYEALKTATVNPARALTLDAGTIEPGKLADIVIVDGNPLSNVENAHKVKWVIANGRVYSVDDLVRGFGTAKLTTAQATPQ